MGSSGSLIGGSGSGCGGSIGPGGTGTGGGSGRWSGGDGRPGTDMRPPSIERRAVQHFPVLSAALTPPSKAQPYSNRGFELRTRDRPKLAFRWCGKSARP